MQQYIEKRDSKRLEVDCEVCVNSLSSDQTYKAFCATLSGSGISLICEHDFSDSEKLEVTIVPNSELMRRMRFFIKIVHKALLDDGRIHYGATILFDESDDENRGNGARAK